MLGVMSFLKSLKLRFSPPRLSDADFGNLLFMYIANAPERSYWECEWKFPRTGTIISIAIPGDDTGPDSRARKFFLALPTRFESIVAACRPQLQEVFSHWLQRDLPADIFSVVKLAGFDLEDPQETLPKWDIAFETTGDKWLGIRIPFVGEVPQKAVVDT